MKKKTTRNGSALAHVNRPTAKHDMGALCTLAAALMWACAATQAQTTAPASTQPADEAVAAAPTTSPTTSPSMAAVAAPSAAVPNAVAESPMSKEELAELEKLYTTSSAERQAELSAYYADLGVDLESVLGISARRSEEAIRSQQLIELISGMDFVRSTESVLAARTKLAISTAFPNPSTASAGLVGEWIRDHYMAGEWALLGQLLKSMPPEQGEMVYGFVLNSLAQRDSGLLPEEVLQVADAAPTKLTPAYRRSLAAIVRASAFKNGTGELMSAIRAGTRWFGAGDEDRRAATIELLAAARLDREVYDFLPPLDEARRLGKGSIILAHGRYKEYLANRLRQSDETDQLRAEAWSLFCEATAAESSTPEDRSEAMQRAIKIMRQLPRAKVTPWLTSVFASKTLAPLAVEKIAIDAASLTDENIERAERISSIVALKEAVDILLASKSMKTETLRVPLRMLTTTISAEMESALGGNAENGQQAGQGNKALLLRAIPSGDWLDAIESSLAVRVSGASIELCTSAGETDRGLELLKDSVRRTPSAARDLADRFLRRWSRQLASGDSETNSNFYSYRYRYYFRQASLLPPVTRGMQRRNLALLRQLIDEIDAVGADARTLPSIAPVFTACHNSAEVFELDDIVRVFGPIDQIPASTARALAESINGAVETFWSDRLKKAPANLLKPGQKAPPKRPNAEIVQVVDRGFATSIKLAQRAEAADPDSWETSLVAASLNFGRFRFNKANGSVDDATKVTRLSECYAAFEKAARVYSESLLRGEVKENPAVFYMWFNCAMGAANVTLIKAEDLPAEGSVQSDQFPRIAAALKALPPDVCARHTGEFAARVEETVNILPPEAKPRFVAAALSVIGNHPAGAPLVARQRLYQELMRDEVKLRLNVDGPDQITAGKPFGVFLTLRFTNAVERETEGFSKYLQNQVYIFGVNGDEREINYKDMLKQGIESAFAKGFDIASISFYDPFLPASGVIEEGQDGWLEKPMAYIIVTPKDVSVDRLPQVTMEMQFEDGGGSVNVVTTSSAPPISIASARSVRPCGNLKVTQTVDARDAGSMDEASNVKLEITAQGRGTIPELGDLLQNMETALPGYEVVADEIDAQPILVLSEAEVEKAARRGTGAAGTSLEPDDEGVVRPLVERSWTVPFKRTDRNTSGIFTFPVLMNGLTGTLESRRYAAMDIETIAGGKVDLNVPKGAIRRTTIAVAIGLCVALIAGVYWILRKRRTPAVLMRMAAMPERITPTAAITTLRKWHGQMPTLSPDHDLLAQDIRELEESCFGVAAKAASVDELRSVLQKWVRQVAPTN